jgi:DNA-binding CsgD family transcriptional regulator
MDQSADYLFLTSDCAGLDIAGITNLISQQTAALGFDKFLYVGACIPVDGACDQTSPTFVTNAPQEWVVSYHERRQHLVDPILQKASASRRPFSWEIERDFHPIRSEQMAVLRDAKRAGLSYGFSVPLHGPGCEVAVFTVAGQSDPRRFKTAVGARAVDLQMLALRAHATIVECALCANEPEDMQLTTRQRECLLWTARGKTAWEVARIIGCSRATVNYHLQKAMRLLSASTKTQAAAKALERHLLVSECCGQLQGVDYHAN